MADLFAGCSSGDEEDTTECSNPALRTNNTYARRYDEWRRKEELMKANARFGKDLEMSSTSDSSEEDELASQWTSEHEKKFFATLSALKGNDPKIYNKDEVIFGEVAANAEESGESERRPPSKKDKTMTLKDYERKIITEEGGVYADEEEMAGVRERLFEETDKSKLAYDEEQRALRDSLKAAAWGDSDREGDASSDDETAPAGGLVVRKERRREQDEKEDEEYIKWLKGETDRLSNKKEAKDLAYLRQLWAENDKGKLDEAEQFLRDYVLNKRYITANEDDVKFEVDFSEDEKDLEQMAEFEHKYNFRFEDPDPEFIKRYPRTIEDSMRRKDTRRPDKKAERKARKEQERIQLREEVNRLKSMKKKEIIAKVEKLKDIAGSTDLAFTEADIEGDFDPEEHDRRMAALFATYDGQAGEDLYPELADEDQNNEDLRWDDWDKYDGRGCVPNQSDDSTENDSDNDELGHGDRLETNAGMNQHDADATPGVSGAMQRESKNGSTSSEDHSGDDDDSDTAIPSGAEKTKVQAETKEHMDESGVERNEEGKLVIRGKKSSKLTLSDVLPPKKEKKRKKSKFAEVMAKSKPTYDPERDKTFERYFDEYYNLDFEDIVAGQPTRFKYRQVVPNDFGLSPEEILNASDKELNKWCSLKKMVQYRSADEEEKDLQAFGSRKHHMRLKQKILTSVYKIDPEKPDQSITEAAGKLGTSKEDNPKSKSRKNKKKKKQQEQHLPSGQDETSNGKQSGSSNLSENKPEAVSESGRGTPGSDANRPVSKKRKSVESDCDSIHAAEGPQKKPKVAVHGHARGSTMELASGDGFKSDIPDKPQANDSFDDHKKQRKSESRESGQGNSGRFEKKFEVASTRFKDKRHSKKVRVRKNEKPEQNSKNTSTKKQAGSPRARSGSEGTAEIEAPKQVEPVPWEKLTAKQKKNRRNALLKKRKKTELREHRAVKATLQKEKFRPLEDLQMSEARMKAYGLNPNKVKGKLVYSVGKKSSSRSQAPGGDSGTDEQKAGNS